MRIIGLVPFEDTTGTHGDDHDLDVVRELLTAGCLDDVLLSADTDADVVSLVNGSDMLLIHDAHLDLAGREAIRSVVDVVRTGSAAAAVAARPVTDTIKLLEPDGTLRSGWERHRLRELRSPLCCRVNLIAELGIIPSVSDLPAGSVRLVADEQPTASS